MINIIVTFVVGAAIRNEGVACIAVIADAGVALSSIVAVGVLADTGVCCPVTHGSNTVGLIHYAPGNHDTTIICYTDSIPQWSSPVRLRPCTVVDFFVPLDKFKVKSTIVKATNIKTTTAGAVTMVPSHRLCDPLVWAHSSAGPCGSAGIVIDPIHVQVTAGDV